MVQQMPAFELTDDTDLLFQEMMKSIIISPDGVHVDENLREALDNLGSESFLAIFHSDPVRTARALRDRLVLLYPILENGEGPQAGALPDGARALFDKLTAYTAEAEAIESRSPQRDWRSIAPTNNRESEPPWEDHVTAYYD